MLPRSPSRAYQELLKSDDAFATPLLIGAMLHFRETDGPEAFEFLSWTPETIIKELEDDFGVKMSQGSIDRLMAGITIATTDLFWQDLRTFIPLCNVLFGHPIAEEFDPATVLEATWAITEAELLCMDVQEEHQFSEEIAGYIYMSCQNEGMLSPPGILARVVGDQISSPGSDFSSDPAFHADVFYNQKMKTLDIERTVFQCAWKVYSQLEKLDLGEGVKAKLAELKRAASMGIEQCNEEESSLDNRE